MVFSGTKTLGSFRCNFPELRNFPYKRLFPRDFLGKQFFNVVYKLISLLKIAKYLLRPLAKDIGVAVEFNRMVLF